jgi:long-chain acyl-CoA synthetase
VTVTHAQLAASGVAIDAAIGRDLSGWSGISYLPMAHQTERFVSHYGHVRHGSEVTCCRDIARLGQVLTEVRPRLFLGVPRVWEKIMAGIQAAAGADPGNKASFDAALETGRRVARAKLAGDELAPSLRADWERADREVLSVARALVGLDACELAFSGAAPLPDQVHEFFLALGVPLSNAYGLTETGIITMEPHAVRLGTVGRVASGVDLRIADDGEILVRSPQVTAGYLNDPDRTAELIDAEGWAHTGDVGSLDADGYLRIVDRKKELIVTSSGKNISPANIEAVLKEAPLVGQACVVGDNQPYLVALIVLDPDTTPAWARAQGIAGEPSLAELAQDPLVQEEVARSVAEANRRFSRIEQVKRFAVLGREWLPDSEELTPTLKLKRRGVHTRYAEEIEALYAEKQI